VQKLRRVAIGPLEDPDLQVGELRELTEVELKSLRHLTAGIEPRRESPHRPDFAQPERRTQRSPGARRPRPPGR
jgi:hypothetical protein